MSAVAAIAGLAVECQTNDPDVAHRFALITPLTRPPPGAPRRVYEITRKSGRGFVVRTGDGEIIAETPHAGNAVVEIELDVRRAAEAMHPGDLWLHAAALAREDGSALVCVGASGAGKSTAALALLDSGWRYLADDAVLLNPGTRELTGLGWPVRFEHFPAPREVLRARGFGLGWDEWVHGEDEVTSSLRIAPPPALSWDGSIPAKLRGCLFLERGPLACDRISVGEALIRLWRGRVRRSDGAESWDPGALAAKLGNVSFGVLRTERVEQLTPAVDAWTRSWTAEGK